MFLCKKKLIGQKYKFENERKTQFFCCTFCTHTHSHPLNKTREFLSFSMKRILEET